MKKALTVTLVVLLALIFSNKIFAQSEGWKLGLQYHELIPGNEFKNNFGLKNSFLGRIILRNNINDNFQMEFGIGYGKYAGLDLNHSYYSSKILPIDLRLLYNLCNNETFRPYLYGGLGVLNYKMKEFPTAPSPLSVDKDGWTGIIPLGFGTEIKLGNDFDMDISLGFTYTFTDNLNYYREGSPKDVYYGVSLGLNIPLFGNPDSDNDGLLNKDEKSLGTDPKNPDTDGDGLSDGDEVLKYKTDPLLKDTDHDGLSDGDEVLKYHTNPLKADTDGDGLSDGDEVLQYHTDPLKADTDGDGLTDGNEILKYQTDPLKIDTDGDKLTDGDEVLKYNTNPLKADTDGDGLSDGDEVLKYHTDPLKADTDGDGLSDGDEVLKYHTDPLNPDTDGGSVNDGVEVNRGTNPLDKTDDIIKVIDSKVGESIVLEGIVFKTGSADILPASEEILLKAFNTLKYNKSMNVEIQGHTDNVGNHAKNMKLSTARAESVKKYLVKKGIDANRITTKGFGPDKPAASNATKEGKQKNRRIEFVRTK
ncbi:MAG: OmpA family protein [Bacteroidota bacterium]|nr:OmpA family protein [Bacteroidota bacterium]